MKTVAFLLLLSILHTPGIAQSQTRAVSLREVPQVNAGSSVTSGIFTTTSGYGYNIFLNKKLFIHQPSIPCYSGNRSFKTKQEASLVAALVIAKIKKGEMPPTVTRQEMQKLGVVVKDAD